MADTAKKSTAPKPERKKPVRSAPVQKDYPNKLAWLKALTEHEEAETAKVNAAKVARLDKRIEVKATAIGTMQNELDKLRRERAALVPAEDQGEVVTGEPAEVDEQPA